MSLHSEPLTSWDYYMNKAPSQEYFAMADSLLQGNALTRSLGFKLKQRQNQARLNRLKRIALFDESRKAMVCSDRVKRGYIMRDETMTLKMEVYGE